MGKFSIPELIKLFQTHKPLKSKKREDLEKLALEIDEV